MGRAGIMKVFHWWVFHGFHPVEAGLRHCFTFSCSMQSNGQDMSTLTMLKMAPWLHSKSSLQVMSLDTFQSLFLSMSLPLQVKRCQGCLLRVFCDDSPNISWFRRCLRQLLHGYLNQWQSSAQHCRTSKPNGSASDCLFNTFHSHRILTYSYHPMISNAFHVLSTSFNVVVPPCSS